MRACQSDYLPLPSMTGPTGAANAVDADATPAGDHAPYTDLVDAADTTGAANAVDADATPAADHAPYTDLVDAADTTDAPPSAPQKKKRNRKKSHAANHVPLEPERVDANLADATVAPTLEPSEPGPTDANRADATVAPTLEPSEPEPTDANCAVATVWRTLEPGQQEPGFSFTDADAIGEWFRAGPEGCRRRRDRRTRRNQWFRMWLASQGYRQ